MQSRHLTVLIPLLIACFAPWALFAQDGGDAVPPAPDPIERARTWIAETIESRQAYAFTPYDPTADAGVWLVEGALDLPGKHTGSAHKCMPISMSRIVDFWNITMGHELGAYVNAVRGNVEGGTDPRKLEAPYLAERDGAGNFDEAWYRRWKTDPHTGELVPVDASQLFRIANETGRATLVDPLYPERSYDYSPYEFFRDPATSQLRLGTLPNTVRAETVIRALGDHGAVLAYISTVVPGVPGHYVAVVGHTKVNGATKLVAVETYGERRQFKLLDPGAVVQAYAFPHQVALRAVQIQGPSSLLRIDAAAANGLPLEATVTARLVRPDGTSSPLTLNRVGTGAYEAPLLPASVPEGTRIVLEADAPYFRAPGGKAWTAEVSLDTLPRTTRATVELANLSALIAIAKENLRIRGEAATAMESHIAAKDAATEGADATVRGSEAYLWAKDRPAALRLLDEARQGVRRVQESLDGLRERLGGNLDRLVEEGSLNADEAARIRAEEAELLPERLAVRPIGSRSWREMGRQALRWGEAWIRRQAPAMTQLVLAMAISKLTVHALEGHYKPFEVIMDELMDELASGEFWGQVFTFGIVDGQVKGFLASRLGQNFLSTLRGRFAVVFLPLAAASVVTTQIFAHDYSFLHDGTLTTKEKLCRLVRTICDTSIWTQEAIITTGLNTVGFALGSLATASIQGWAAGAAGAAGLTGTAGTLLAGPVGTVVCLAATMVLAHFVSKLAVPIDRGLDLGRVSRKRDKVDRLLRMLADPAWVDPARADEGLSLREQGEIALALGLETLNRLKELRGGDEIVPALCAELLAYEEDGAADLDPAKMGDCALRELFEARLTCIQNHNAEMQAEIGQFMEYLQEKTNRIDWLETTPEFDDYRLVRRLFDVDGSRLADGEAARRFFDFASVEDVTEQALVYFRTRVAQLLMSLALDNPLELDAATCERLGRDDRDLDSEILRRWLVLRHEQFQAAVARKTENLYAGLEDWAERLDEERTKALSALVELLDGEITWCHRFRDLEGGLDYQPVGAGPQGRVAIPAAGLVLVGRAVGARKTMLQNLKSFYEEQLDGQTAFDGELGSLVGATN